jgi:polar amino acid transport system substrate-binding protein
MHGWISARAGVGGGLLAAAVAMACGVPRDADHTLDRVRGRELRVGVTDHPPWVEVRDDRVSGVEPSLVNELARGLHARPTFRRGSESELMEALHRGELDLVAAGLHDGSPWKGRVALTKPYYTDSATSEKHVLAVRAGENAWLVHVETFLTTHHSVATPGETAAQ